MSHLVAPSILSADFSNLKKDIEMINTSQADWFHLDVMDGVFVPNISFGFPVIKQIKKHTTKPLDVHLMIIEPERYFKMFKEVGADILSFHVEASKDLGQNIQMIKDLGMRAGIVIKPKTPVNQVADVLSEVDMVLVMSVEPGFGGQKFIEGSYKKITDLKNLIIQKNSGALIEVDGGVNLENAGKLVDVGADILVAGNTIFSADDPVKTIEELKRF